MNCSSLLKLKTYTSVVAINGLFVNGIFYVDCQRESLFIKQNLLGIKAIQSILKRILEEKSFSEGT